MQSRKQLFAEKRKREAQERKAFNRDQFIRKLLKRKGLQVCFDAPDKECFRGYQAWVDKIIQANDCAIGVVLGCANCKNSATAFDKIQRGEITNLSFKCRMWANKPKFWIMQPNEKVLGPGLHLVRRTKPVYDTHGHIIEPGMPHTTVHVPIHNAAPELPHIIPSPATQPGAHAPQPVADLPTGEVLTVPIQADGAWLEDPQAYLVEVLAQALPLLSPEHHLTQVLIQAYTQERLRVQVVNGYMQFSIAEEIF